MTGLVSAKRRPVMVVPPPMMYSRKGADVADLQVLLRDAGLYDHDIDGYYGNYLRVSVYLFQERFGVFADGHWNEATVAAANALLGPDGTVDSRVLCGLDIA